MNGWAPHPMDGWQETAALLTSTGRAWPECSAVFDLRWHMRRAESRGRDPMSGLPGRQALARRWHWTEWSVRQLLADEAKWQDGARTKAAAQTPPKRRQPAEGPTPTIGEVPPNRRLNASTRALILQVQKTEDLPPTPSASGGGFPVGGCVEPPSPDHVDLVTRALQRRVSAEVLHRLVAGEAGVLEAVRTLLGDALPIELRRLRKLMVAVRAAAPFIECTGPPDDDPSELPADVYVDVDVEPEPPQPPSRPPPDQDAAGARLQVEPEAVERPRPPSAIGSTGAMAPAVRARLDAALARVRAADPAAARARLEAAQAQAQGKPTAKAEPAGPQVQVAPEVQEQPRPPASARPQVGPVQVLVESAPIAVGAAAGPATATHACRASSQPARARGPPGPHQTRPQPTTTDHNRPPQRPACSPHSSPTPACP